MHIYNSISRVALPLLEMPRPHIVHPVNEIHLHNKKGKKSLYFRTELVKKRLSSIAILLLRLNVTLKILKVTKYHSHQNPEVMRVLTEDGRLTRFSSRVWLNSRLMTL